MVSNRQNRFSRCIIVLVLMSGLMMIMLGGCKKKEKAAPKPEPPTVTVAKVVLKTVPVHINYVATTEAVKTVDIRARVEGFLVQRRFKEGGDVKKGDLVFVIEREPYQAELERSMAQLAKDEATLAFALEQVKRYGPLAEQDFVTRERFDEYRTKAKEAAAAAKADRARIKQDRLNLSYCTMYSPLNGRIGRTLVNVGNLVGASGQDTKLATIVQLDPMYGYFSPSEKDIRLILKHRQKKEIPVDIILSNGSTHAYPGKVDFIDNMADPKANTINMRAVIPNPEKTLLPGTYVQASLFLCNVPDTPLISEKAIAEDQTGMYVYVVGKDNKVEKRPVKVGFLYKHQKIIWKGLKAGDCVITEGLQMVRPGMVVRPKEASPGKPGKDGESAESQEKQQNNGKGDSAKPNDSAASN
ncbi:MAG: efflux RND transporter periplasmic adaptor subunit [Thermodesulfobacteriota bacterium]|nr:efflux RND transporter periplasmic adaptor subunit [Thermodesulfobacteriota bacterium]